MSDNADQLAVLGQQVLDTISRTYNPSKDPGVALALHPGQALADDIVQEGQTNPLRLSEWVEDQYDYPLLLTLADATSIAASSIDASESVPDDGGCDCRGECCSSAPVRDTPPTGIVLASIVRVGTPRLQQTGADRPIDRIAYLLPFATAPPRLLTA